MDTLTQTKLSRAEWKTIEEPISPGEKNVVSLIKTGYHDINRKTNATLTMITFTKMEQSPEIDLYLYQRFLKTDILAMIEKYGKSHKTLTNFTVKENTIKK